MQFHFQNSKLEAIVALTLDANNVDVTLNGKKYIYRVMEPNVDYFDDTRFWEESKKL